MSSERIVIECSTNDNDEGDSQLDGVRFQDGQFGLDIMLKNDPLNAVGVVLSEKDRQRLVAFLTQD